MTSQHVDPRLILTSSLLMCTLQDKCVVW